MFHFVPIAFCAVTEHCSEESGCVSTLSHQVIEYIFSIQLCFKNMQMFLFFKSSAEMAL